MERIEPTTEHELVCVHLIFIFIIKADKESGK